MAVAFQSESHATVLVDATVVTKPTGTVDGDLLIVVLGSRSGTIDSVPSGWALVDSQDTAPGSNIIAYAYWKVASSEGTDWTWGWTTSSTTRLWSAFRFDGAVAAVPSAHAANFIENDSTPSWSNTITPPIPDSILLMAIYDRDSTGAGVGSYAIATSDPTWTERVDVQDGIHAMAAATGPRTAVTATGNSSATLVGTTNDSICFLMAIAPRVDATVNPSVLAIASTVPQPGVGVDYAMSTLSIAVSIPAPTVTTPAATIFNTSKTSASPSNTTKNAATATNTSKSSSTWTNTSKNNV